MSATFSSGRERAGDKIVKNACETPQIIEKNCLHHTGVENSLSRPPAVTKHKNKPNYRLGELSNTDRRIHHHHILSF